MISYEEACSIVLDNVQPLSKARVKLNKIRGSMLAEPVIANQDQPLFDNSSVDGYGVLISDIRNASSSQPVSLKICGEIKAGDSPQDVLNSSCAYKIFTGAVIPQGVEAVVMREMCQEENGTVKVTHCPQVGDNIRRRGGEFLRGQTILSNGTKVTPPVIGLLAALGQASFMVHKKPTVAIISTGNELVKPGKNLSPGKIYDANSFALKAALEDIGIDDFLPLHSREDLAETRKVLRLALDFADIVITVGGISVGDHDYVKQVCEELNVKTAVYKVAMKPGKPFYFGTATSRKSEHKKYVFGLPGNPVSALVTYNQLVKPAILKIMGSDSASPSQPLEKVKARLGCDISKQAGRLEFVRARIFLKDGQLIAEPTVGQDSHMLSGLCLANGLIVFPADKDLLMRGDLVDVDLLGWTW